MNLLTIKPIGIINTPYQTSKAERFSEYTDGLKDLEGFSHAYLIYYFNRAKTEELISKPYLEDTKHGIFAIRSPKRPNHIGISIVKLKKIIGSKITFSEVDILNDTPCF